MVRRALPLNLLLFCYLLILASAHAQSAISDICPSNNKLVCTLPEVYGPAGFQPKIGPLVKVDGHGGGHFEGSFISSLGGLNAAVGSELTLLPLGSPGSGLVYVYDPSLKTFTASTEDLGPILTERANTTGRHKFRVGITYQRFSFNSLDGASLHSLPASFVHIDDMGSNGTPDSTGGVQLPPGTDCQTNNQVTGPNNSGLCGFVRDRISTVTNINLRLNQVTASATFGLTSRIDLSLAIPIANVGMDVTSDATIIDNSHSGNHQFKAPGCPLLPPGGVPPPGQAVPPTSPCGHQVFANSNSATGIGDVVLRAKGVVWSGERAAVALGADIRFPTGDELNFLGSGTYGFTPFAVFSYAARVSPHVNVGFEENGNSTLAGEIVPPSITTPSAFTKGHLPNQFLYSGGIDVVVVQRRLAGTLDLIGQRVFNARRATVTAQSFLGPCGPAGLAPADTANSNGYCNSPGPNVSAAALTPTKGSFNIENAAVGAKLRVTDKFVIFGNALIKLNESGLRANVVPLVGASFSF